jgi:TetR/AcrR family transcriptional regulator, transcriptional repressor for nem operon
MDDLVQATGVSKHGIYSDFGGKRELFLACFDQYQALVVTPAFAVVEKAGANLESIGQYFDAQISLAEEVGLPGPGCFVANSATEVAPHDEDVRSQVHAHNTRLLSGFRHALTNTSSDLRPGRSEEIADLAMTILVFSIGLWSASRNTSDGHSLRRAVKTFLSNIEGRLK